VLRGAYRQAWLRTQQQLRCAGEALRALRAAGLDTLVLKGAALAVQCYPSDGVRPMVDVDVLVRTERAREAADVLVRAGWTRPPGPSLGAVMPIMPGTAFGDSHGGLVDLHWHSLSAPWDESDFWDAALPIEIAGAPALALCPADQLLQVSVHGVWSGGRQPARWLADAAMVLRSAGAGLDWDRLIERARARSLTLPMAAALRHLGEWLEPDMPSRVVDELERTARGRFEAATHWAWTGAPTRTRRAVILTDNYLRRRRLPPSEARPENLIAYVDAYASTAWGVEHRGSIPITALRRFVRRELYAA
jgi:hypothetical protein